MTRCLVPEKNADKVEHDCSVHDCGLSAACTIWEGAVHGVYQIQQAVAFADGL